MKKKHPLLKALSENGSGILTQGTCLLSLTSQEISLLQGTPMEMWQRTIEEPQRRALGELEEIMFEIWFSYGLTSLGSALCKTTHVVEAPTESFSVVARIQNEEIWIEIYPYDDHHANFSAQLLRKSNLTVENSNYNFDALKKSQENAIEKILNV